MTRVLVLTAVDLEARALARHLGLARVSATDWPHFAGGALEVACVGLRAAHLEARAARCGVPTLVVSAGTCGALAPDLREGDLVLPEMVLTPAGARLPTARLGALSPRGALLAVDEVAADASAKTRLWMQTGALALDMESGVILAWAAARGVPATVVRAVSDTARRGVPADLAAVVADDGRVRPLRAVTAALARPRALTDALTLRSATATALKTVAHALAPLARIS